MNRSIYIIIAVFPFYCLSACHKQSLLTYSATNNIYFSVGDAAIINPAYPIIDYEDSLDVTFSFSPAAVQDSIVKVPVAVTGSPQNHDRAFTVTADPASTAIAGKHYKLPDSIVIHAGLVLDSIPVTFYRTTDLQTKGIELILHLSPNANFNTDIPYSTNRLNAADSNLSVLNFKITVSDIITAGPYWTSVFATYFGNFSVKKLKLLNQVTGMPLNFTINLNNLELGAQASYFAIAMSRYLEDQASAGNTIYEDDGITPMTMGPTYQ